MEEIIASVWREATRSAPPDRDCVSAKRLTRTWHKKFILMGLHSLHYFSSLEVLHAATVCSWKRRYAPVHRTRSMQGRSSIPQRYLPESLQHIPRTYTMRAHGTALASVHLRCPYYISVEVIRNGKTCVTMREDAHFVVDVQNNTTQGGTVTS